VVVHSRAPAKRRQPRLARDLPASYRTLQTTARPAAPQAYGCRAEAAAAAATRRTAPPTDPLLDGTVAERPVYGRGRPSAHQPRPVNARRERLNTTLQPHTERLSGPAAAAGCCVRLTNVPLAGILAHRAREIRTVDQAPQGTEQHDGCLTAPVLVHRRFLQTPERMAAWGGVWVRSRRRWRLMARQRRAPVERTGAPWMGWATKTTERPTTLMMLTTCAGVLGLKVGPQRPLARPRSAVPEPDRVARRVPVTCCPLPAG
jgi:hypothetical protein